MLLSVVVLTQAVTSPATAAPEKSTAAPLPLPTAAARLLAQAAAAEKNNDLLNAQELYEKFLEDFPEIGNQTSGAKKKLWDINTKIILSSLYTPDCILYTVEPGDTLAKIAKRFSVTQELLKISNGLKSDTIYYGKKLRIWTKPLQIVIDKSKNRLTLKSADQVIKIYPVATGENGGTPAGEFTITSRLENPVWFRKGEPIAPDDPRNALGTRWLGFNYPQYGIHGTIRPDLIGQQVSHGCVRMRNKDVEELYVLVPEGTKVTIHD
ncbi:MAG: L,D-transpeptidase family protein [Candidatus Omnitrophica bacterium]|nr:L,D-transpeptidase family protein [Candidatus Omnitrophota bacterium]